jgi:hypothetical protein
MKRLEIKGFASLASKLVSDKFRIEDMDILNDMYMIQLRTSEYQYRIDIVREAMEVKSKGLNYRYQLWIYDWNRKSSYPMEVTTQDLISLDNFTHFLKNILDIADRGGFNGTKGDWRFKKYNL